MKIKKEIERKIREDVENWLGPNAQTSNFLLYEITSGLLIEFVKRMLKKYGNLPED